MTRYTCEGFRPILVHPDNPPDEPPAKTFARRFARRAYGRRGKVIGLRAESMQHAGEYVVYEAWIGTSLHGPRYGAQGHNIQFTVHRHKEG